MRKSFFLYCICFLILFSHASSLCAATLPEVDIKTAVLSGSAAFWGRVVRLEEVERADFYTTVEAEIELLRVFYGIKQPVGKKIKLRYFSELFEYASFPINIYISSEVVFVINRPIKADEVIFFYSKWSEGLDLAYIRRSIQPKADETKQENIWFASVYGSGLIENSSKVNIKELEGWAKERLIQLEKANK